METQIGFIPAVGQTPDNQTYGGHYVLMMLTGKSKEHIRRDINLIKRKAGAKTKQRGTGKTVPWNLDNPVRGITHGTLETVMQKYGMKAEKKVLEKEMTVRRFYEDIAHLDKAIVFYIRGHYMLLWHGKIYDTFRPEGVLPSEYPFEKHRVKRYWIIRRTKAVEPGFNYVPKSKKEKPKPDPRFKRYEAARKNHKKWVSKLKRAETAEKKWRKKVAYYEGIMRKGLD